jgi:hypothetical protein
MYFRLFAVLAGSAFVAGCMPPYFPTYSDDTPAGRHIANIPIAEVIKQVKCEVQTFLREESEKRRRNPTLQIDEDLYTQIDLALKTDETGQLAFSALDLRKMGFHNFAQLISGKSPPKDLTPFLNANFQARALRTVTMSVMMPQLPPNKKQQAHLTDDCARDGLRAANRLYIKEWLTRFMDKAEGVVVDDSDLVQLEGGGRKLTGKVTSQGALTGNLEAPVPPKETVVKDVILNQIQLVTEFHVIVDVTAAPNLFRTVGAGGFYLIPVQAPATLEYKPDFAHTLTITLKGLGQAAFANTKKKGLIGRTTDTQTRNLKLLLSPPAPIITLPPQ